MRRAEREEVGEICQRARPPTGSRGGSDSRRTAPGTPDDHTCGTSCAALVAVRGWRCGARRRRRSGRRCRRRRSGSRPPRTPAAGSSPVAGTRRSTSRRSSARGDRREASGGPCGGTARARCDRPRGRWSSRRRTPRRRGVRVRCPKCRRADERYRGAVSRAAQTAAPRSGSSSAWSCHMPVWRSIQRRTLDRRFISSSRFSPSSRSSRRARSRQRRSNADTVIAAASPSSSASRPASCSRASSSRLRVALAMASTCPVDTLPSASASANPGEGFAHLGSGVGRPGVASASAGPGRTASPRRTR